MKAKAAWIAISLGGVICLLAVVFLLRDRLIAPRLIPLIQEALNRALGVEVAIGRLGGSLAADIEIEDLQTLAPGTRGPVASLAAKRLHIRYSPLALLKGLAGFVDTMRIEAEGLQADLDLGCGASSPEVSPSAFFPLMLPAVQARDAAIALRWGDLRTHFDGITLNVEKDSAEARRMHLTVADWSWFHPRLATGRTTVAAQLALIPDSIAIQNLSLGGEQVTAHGRFGRVGPNDPFAFEAQLNLASGRLSLAGDFSSALLNAKLKADQVELGPIAALFLQPISGLLSTEVDLSVPFDRPDAATGQLALAVLNAKIQGIDLTKAGGEATVADGWVRVTAIEAASRRSRLSVSAAAAPLRQFLDGSWGDFLKAFSGRFELYSEDLPQLLKMTGLAVDSPPGRIPEHRLELAGRCDAGYLRIPDAGLTSGSNRIRLQNLETRLPPAPPNTPLRGDLRIDLPDLEVLSRIVPIASASGSVKADATIGGTHGRPEADATVAAENLKLGDLHVGAVSLKVRCTQQQILVKTLAIRRGADLLSANGSIRLPAGHIDAAELSFSIADLEWLGTYLLPAAWTLGGERPRIQGRAQGQARLAGHWSSPDGELAVALDDLGLRGQRLGAGSMRITKKGATVTADSIRLVQGEDRLELHGSLDLTDGHLGATRLQLGCGEIGPYLNAVAPQWGWLTGRAAAVIEGSGPLGQPDFKLDLFLERIKTAFHSLGDTRVQAQGTGRHVRLERAETLTPAGKMQIAGSLTWNPAGTIFDATLEDFSLSGDELHLAMEAPARARYEAPDRLSVERFEAGGPQGRIAARGVLAFHGKSDLAVEVTRVNSAGWLSKLAGIPLVIEGMDASLHMRGTASAPEITLAGTVRQLGAEGQLLTLAGRFDLSYAGRRLRIDTFEWTSAGGHRVALTGALPIDPAGDRVLAPGALSVSAAASLPDQELPLRLVPTWPIASGSIEAEMELQGTWAAPRGALRVNGRDMNPADASGFMPPGPYEAYLEMAIEERRISCQTLAVKGLHAQLQVAGVWQDYPALTRWGVERPPPEGTVTLEGRLAAPDLGWLTPGFKDIRRLAGRLDVDLKVEGPLRDPRLQADIRMAEGELRPDADMPPLQALNLEAGLVGKNLTVHSLRGELGGAPFQVTGSVENILAADGHPRVNLQLKGENLLLHRSQALRVRADADLRLNGPLERLSLSGHIALTDGLFTKNLGLAEGLTAGSAKPKAVPGIEIFSIETSPFRDMVLDVRISAGRPFQIKNNLVKGAVRPDLVLTGTGEAPELVGRVYLDATTLFLPAGRMQFDSGVIHFEAIDPGRPRLDMAGSARMIGYDITAVVEGPYDEPSVTLSSAPPLPDADLLALVLTGQPPKTPGSDSAEKRQGLNVAVFIGRDILMRMPGGGTTESLQAVLERFDVEVGRSVTRTGDETINARFRLADGVVRKGDGLYITGEKDVFDHFNAGVRIVFRFR